MAHDTRTTADRIAAIARHGPDPITDNQRERATALLDSLLAAAAEHSATLADFDWTVDLPGACIDVIRSHDHRAAQTR